MVDLRTDFQKARDARAEKVVVLYKRLLDEAPDSSPHAKMNYIIEELNKEGEYITLVGVKGILIRNGLYATTT